MDSKTVLHYTWSKFKMQNSRALCMYHTMLMLVPCWCVYCLLRIEILKVILIILYAELLGSTAVQKNHTTFLVPLSVAFLILLSATSILLKMYRFW